MSAPFAAAHSRGAMLSYMSISHGYRDGVGNEHNSCYLKSVSLGIISNPHVYASYLLMTYRIHGSEIMFLQNVTPV